MTAKEVETKEADRRYRLDFRGDNSIGELIAERWTRSAGGTVEGDRSNSSSEGIASHKGLRTVARRAHAMSRARGAPDGSSWRLVHRLGDELAGWSLSARKSRR